VIPWFHPAYKAGGPIQSIANLVEQMAVGSRHEAVSSEQSAAGTFLQTQDDTEGGENDEFNIFCSNKDLDGSFLQSVFFDEWVTYNSNTKVWYASNNNILPALQDEIKLEKPDHLFIVGLYDWQFNFKPLLFCKGVKKIVSVRGMLHPGALSQKSFKKKIYLGLWKMMGLHKRAFFHATDVDEKKYIHDVFGQSVNVKVAANFPRVFNEQPVVKKKPGQLKLVSVALISPMKNILLVLEALGNDQLVVDKIDYNIYGPVKDKQYWEECLACIKKVPVNISVTYHGDISPDKIEEALAANHVFILPSKSENYGHSIVEALYAGRPVITSNNTPWNELESEKAGANISLTDKQELVDAIRGFAVMNQEELEAWSKGARAYVEKAVNMETIMQQYNELFA
jgi:glycosyltransferase involved in cell wall biosynthesis